MIEIIFIAVLTASNLFTFRKGFKLGIKKEQQARLRRLNSLKKLFRTNA